MQNIKYTETLGLSVNHGHELQDEDDLRRWRRFFSLTKHFLLFFFGCMQVFLSQKIVSIVSIVSKVMQSISIPVDF
jgi:hypothetical protein